MALSGHFDRPVPQENFTVCLLQHPRTKAILDHSVNIYCGHSALVQVLFFAFLLPILVRLGKRKRTLPPEGVSGAKTRPLGSSAETVVYGLERLPLTWETGVRFPAGTAEKNFSKEKFIQVL